MIDSVGMREYAGFCPLVRISPGAKCGVSGADAAVEKMSEHQGRAAPVRPTEKEQREIDRLEKQDREVRSHEAAHVAAGGHYVRGGASFKFETGPDGKRYASGGEVSIDTSPVRGDPEATIRKMQAVRRAALAPANPSGQDRSVAAKASQQEAAARAEAAQESNGSDKNTISNSKIYSPHAETAKRYERASAYHDLRTSQTAFERRRINLIG